MLKAGLILGAVMLVLAGITGAVNFQLCAPCLALFAGLGAGYLAGLFDKPGSNGVSAKAGAGAGAIGGIGAVLGHLAGGLIGALTMGPEKASQLMEQLGLPAAGTGPGTEVGYWVGAIGGSCCLGLLDVALMAGLGALGGLLWWQVTGKNSAPPPAVLPPSM